MTAAEKNRRIYGFAKEYLLSHLPEGLSEADLAKYYKGDSIGAKNLRDVFIVFVQSAQQYQRMPKVIQFVERRSEIERILQGFDYKAVSKMDEMELYNRFRDRFKITSKDSKMNSWYKWSCAVIDSAKFVNGFKDLAGFNAFVKRFDYNSDTRMALPLLISTKIRGVGFALACNALKELGYLEYPKPDVHMMDICEELGLSSRSPYEVFEAIVKMAADNDVTPYEVDKVLWLICSGRYYKDDTTDKPRKDEFIEACKNNLH